MIESGKHAVIVGKTGSGKSQQLLYQAQVCDQPVIILDTKLDDDFLYLARKNQKLVVCDDYRGLSIQLKKDDADYIIVRPQEFELAEPKALDNYLSLIYNKSGDKTVCLDEAYQFHSGAGRAGAGVISLLTRGRSRGLSLVSCTQRPVWISKFLLSESSYFFVYELGQKTDRKAVSDCVAYDGENPPRFHYYYSDFTMQNSELREPVKVFKRREPPPRNGFFNFFK